MQISLAVSVSKDVRQAAGEFLEQLKATPDCMRVMLHILMTDHDEHTPVIRQLALSICTDWLKTWWNQIIADDQNVIRTNFLTLLHSDAVGLSPTRSLRVKLSSALANIAERQYPQHWPSFLEDMVGVWQTSPLERQEVVVLCIEAVIMDCINSDYSSSLPSNRRQDILAGFKLQLGGLFHTAYASLLDNCHKYQQYPLDSPESRAVVSIANATMKMVRPFINFIKPVEACKEPHDFAGLALGMLSLPGLQIEAAALLQTITEDKLPLDLFGRLLQSISSNPVTVYPPDFGDCVTFQRTYAEAVFSMLGQNIGQATEPSFLANESAGPLLGQYVGLMAKLMENASSRLAADIVKDWIRIFKEPAITTLPWMTDVCHGVLHVYANKTVRSLWVDDHTRPLSEMDHAEFDEFDDYCDFCGKFFSQTRILIDIMAKKFPSVCASFLYNKVAQTVAAHGSIAHKKGLDSIKDADAVREWEGMLIVLNVIFKGLEHLSDQSVGPALTATVDTLVAWQVNPADALLMTLRIKAIQFSAPILRISPQHLFLAFKALIDQIQASAQASLAISYLAEKCSREIVASNLVSELVPKLIEVIKHEGMGAHPKAHACEALVAISESIEDQQHRGQLLVAALGDMVQTWQQWTATIFASPEGLLQQCFNSPDLPGGGLADVITLLNSLLTTSKKVALPRMPDEVWTQSLGFTSDQLRQIFSFTSVWLEILPGVLAAVQCLHGLFSGETRQQLSRKAEYAQMYLLTPKEIRQAAGVVTADSPASLTDDGAAPTEAVIKVVRRELLELRSSLYQLLGQASSHKVLYVGAAQSWLAGIAAALPFMENTHASMLMQRFVEPYVLNAPPANYDDTASFLSLFMRESLVRLGVAWDRRDNGNGASAGGSAAAAEADGDAAVARYIYRHCSLPAGQAYAGVDPETLEIAKDKMIGELTKAYAETLASFGMCRSFLALSVPTDVPGSIATLGGDAPQRPGEKKDRREKKAASQQLKAVSTSTEAQQDDEAASSAGALDEQHRDRQKHARRAKMHDLIMRADRVGVTKPFVESVVALLCIPDADACRWGLLLAKSLSEQLITDPRLFVAVGKDAFSAALGVLLREEKFSTGLEWLLTDFCQDVYCGLLLGCPMGDLPPTSHFQPYHCDYPRQVLLQVPGSSPERVQQLEHQMSCVLTKKKRRELFKDFVFESVRASCGGAGQPSVLSVTDIRERFLVSKAKKATTSCGGLLDAAGQETGLCSLFD